MTQDFDHNTPQDSAALTATETRSWLTSPVTIVIAAALLRGIALYAFEGTLHDGSTRVGTAWAWLFQNTPIFGRTPWPEGNYLLPAVALLIWDEQYWSVRVIYALTGLSNVWVVYLLGKAVYGRTAGAVAGWIVALMPYHILVSAEAAMSEPPYVSLILLALLAAVRYHVKPGPWLAAGAGLALTLATMFRIDGVIWGIPLALSIAIAALRSGDAKSLAFRDLIIFGMCGLLYPAALFIQWTMLYPDPFHILNQAKLNTHQFFVNGEHPRWPTSLYQSYAVAFWPASTFVLLTPAVAALGWIGVAEAIRERRHHAIPLVLGLFVVCAWLAYATFKHDIQTQWRYALVLVVVLTVFSLPGARALARSSRAFTLHHIAMVAISAALVWQSFITYVTFVDCGALTRQLGILSPIRPNQFGSQTLLAWINANSTAIAPVVLTPHVLESPYLAKHRKDLESSGRIIVQSYYLPRSILVHTRASLTTDLLKKLSGARFVATNSSLRELGLQDGLVREVIEPVLNIDGTYNWQGVQLRLIQQFGSNRVWEIIHPEKTPAS